MMRTRLIRSIWFARYGLRPFRFGVALRQGTSRLRSLLTGQKGFRVVDLALGYACNLSCEHCSSAPLIHSGEPLLLDDYQRIADQARGLDNLSWNLTGGEPLMVPFLDDLIPVLKPERNYISLQTNGMLLDYDRARSLAALGVNCITTSLDSIDKESHNRFRGNSKSYDRVLSAIDNARRAGMQVLVGGTVTHATIRSDELKSLIRFVNRAGAIFLFNLAVPCGNWKLNKEVLLTPDDRLYLNGLLHQYPMTSTDHEPGRNRKGCPAGMEKLYITPYGDVLPCPFIHVSFGNIRHTSLSSCVNRMRQVSWFSRYQPICVAAEDPEFHRTVLPRVHAAGTSLPVPYTDVFF